MKKKKVEKGKEKISKPLKNLKVFYIYVFCRITDLQTEKIFIELMLIKQMNLHKKKNLASIVNSTREIKVSKFTKP